MLLGLLRGLVSQPLVASTAALGESDRRRATQCALTLTCVGSAASVALMAGAGIVAGGSLGRALLLFAPWMLPALVQDLWRSTLFRDSRGAAAAANDSLWLAVMAPTLVGAWIVGTDWAVVAAWGVGASVSAAAGFFQTHAQPLPVGTAIRFWRSNLLPFGRWLLAGAITYTVAGQATVFMTAGLLGTAALGGLRAVQTVFAPLTLLLPGIGLPALPIMVRRLAAAVDDARAFAFRVSVLLASLTAAYVAVVGLGGSQLIGGIFGHSFERYHSLIFPVAVGQIAGASGAGFNLLLQAGRRGRAIFGVYAATVPFTLAFVPIGAWLDGLVGVAWAAAAGQVIWVATSAVVSLRGASQVDVGGDDRAREPAIQL